MYLYPENLTARPMLWLWTLRDVAWIGTGLLLSVLALTQTGSMIPLVITAALAFLCIRHGGISMLDFLRYAAAFFFFGQQYPAGWLEHSYVACCGTSIQPVLERLRQNPKLDTVYLCLDNDEAGEDACDGMMDTLEDMGYDVERLRPEGKDWNDDLRAKRGGHG